MHGGFHHKSSILKLYTQWKERGQGLAITPKVVKYDRAEILWDFKIQANKLMLAIPPDIVLVDKKNRRWKHKYYDRRSIDLLRD